MVTYLINTGCCGLHTVHSSFPAGATATGWEISSFLSSLYYLFKDSPARREDFMKGSSSSIMPLTFVNHRWLESVPVCERTLLIMEKVQLYVTGVEMDSLTNWAVKHILL